MDTLREISIDALKKYYTDWLKLKPEYRKILDWFEKYKINNYQDLDKFLKSNEADELDYLHRAELKQAIEEVRTTITERDQKKLQPLHSFETYQHAGIDLELAATVDQKNYGDVLLLNFPDRISKMRADVALSRVQLDKIKKSLGQRTPHELKNGIYDLVTFQNKRPLEKLVESIDFYDEQVVRMILSGELDANNCCLNYHLPEKSRLVAEQIKDILEYIIENSTPETITIWGKLSKSRIEFLKTLANTKTTGPLKEALREQVVRDISLYLTEAESAKGMLNSQSIPRVTEDGIVYEVGIPIDRFINPPRRR